MTHKEYLRRVNTIEFKLKGPIQEEALDNLEYAYMKSLEEHLDIEWVKSMDDGSYDEDIAGHIRHWSTGGRMVITEHIDLV